MKLVKTYMYFLLPPSLSLFPGRHWEVDIFVSSLSTEPRGVALGGPPMPFKKLLLCLLLSPGTCECKPQWLSDQGDLEDHIHWMTAIKIGVANVR